MIGIISDIHGNYPALMAVLNELDNLNCSRIIVLGDIVGYYCMHNECIEELRRRNVIHLLGNHDHYLVNNVLCERSNVVNRCISWQRNKITRDNLEWLKSSVITWDDNLISARHAGWSDPIEEYVEEFAFNEVSSYKQKYYISGHTHIQCINYSGDKVYCNPGSVGQPRDGNKDAAFAVISENIELCRVPYDIDCIVKCMMHEGFEWRISECLYSGTRIKSLRK